MQLHWPIVTTKGFTFPMVDYMLCYVMLHVNQPWVSDDARVVIHKPLNLDKRVGQPLFCQPFLQTRLQREENIHV